MASIQGVKVTGVIVPSDTLDTYAVIDPIYGIDGLRNLTGGTSDLSLITTDRRRAGMLVGINNGASYYKLNPAPWSNTLSDWTEFTVGGSFTGGTVTGATNFTNGLTANTISATTYLNLPITIVNSTNLFSTGLAGTGLNTSELNNSIFLGTNAGRDASGATSSFYFGENAGDGAVFSFNSNFFGSEAGKGASSAFYSNFFGANAGFQAIGAYQSNFYGLNAGHQATNSTQSNFIGINAGYQASNVSFSNFIGYQTGLQAVGANYSNFIGEYSGFKAVGVNNTNFIGNYAGTGATNTTYSNFIGTNAGMDVTNTNYSTLIGYNVGRNPVPSTLSIGSNNIIIGTNISLPSGATNSINLGGVLFGTGTYSTITGNPSITGQNNGRIGINVVNPTANLHVYSETVNTSGLRLERLTSASPTSIGQPIGVDVNGNVVTISGSSGTDIYVTGGTYTAGTATLTNNIGGTFSITGFSIDNLQKTISSSYTATSTDNNYSIMINNGVNPITITIPSGLLSKINIGFIQQGSGDVTIVAGAGVTINTPISGGYKIKGVNYNAYLEQVNSSDVYQLLGNLKV
jgi:hypothetical protein